ncbi:hypothetical protein HanRHA438_Chr03g0138091 [Helianthus annuus]|nr:hypothetical protein HanRHA438_Chr03g0138091 [Helianthus annuus]
MFLSFFCKSAIFLLCIFVVFCGSITFFYFLFKKMKVFKFLFSIHIAFYY